MLDVETVRKDFPILQKQFGGKELVYFDSACMSLRPKSVIDAVMRYYTELSACAGRSNHRLAQLVADEVDETRKTMSRFIGAKKPEEIVFTRNTTEGLNLLANSLKLEPGDVVLTSDKEHNSNLVPWQKLVETIGILHRVIPSNEDSSFNMEAFDELLNDEVKVVSVVQTSNLDGVTFPIADIAKKAKKVGATVIVDAAQSAPHKDLDVAKLGADFVAFSGHKMLGPSGIGVLYGRYNLLEKLDGFMVGGDTVDHTTYKDYALLPPPEKFEAGLQDYAGIMGLKAAVEYLTEIGMDEIRDHEIELNEMMTRGMAEIGRVQIIGPAEAKLRGGIVSFSVEGADPHQVALMLDESNAIMVRSGQHCVHSWFENRGIGGSVRASMYVYNSKDDVEIFLDALKKVVMVV